MPLILESHDSLPYVDDEVTPEARERVNALIQRELRSVDTRTEHPLLPEAVEPSFSEIMEQEVQRVGAGQPRTGGIDLTRYEEPDEPTADEDPQVWRKSLRSAYISSTYLAGRHTNLGLLEELGKNAWLMGNLQLDQVLKSLEQELNVLKEEVDEVNRSRKLAQEGSKGEILALDDTWRKGIGRLIEVQLAIDQLRHQTS